MNTGAAAVFVNRSRQRWANRRRIAARPTTMRGALLLLVGLLAAASSARSMMRPVRIAVLHADPYAVKAMMEGQPIVSPEISTILRLMGQAAAASAAESATNLLMGGRLFVNPTDNSLWWTLDPSV